MKTAEQLYYDTFVGLNIEDNKDLIPEIMIKFAQIHVEAASKAAQERIYINDETEDTEIDGMFFANRDSILNCYPLENIK